VTAGRVLGSPRQFGTGDDAITVSLAAGAGGIADIPPRPWAYGNFLLFGEAAAIGAVDGGGKSAQAVAIGLSFVTGHSLLGEKVWRTGQVVVLTYEDDEVEWRRRIGAACLYYGPKYGFSYDDVIGGFHFISHPSHSIALAAPGPDRTILFPHGDNIIAGLKDVAAALLIVDPLNQAHELDDGNNNVLIAKLAREIGRIAKESGAAALVLHHLRKGSIGDPDDLMGATALRATFRGGARILKRMVPEEAKSLHVAERQAFRHSRISGTKANYAMPPKHAIWYRLESIELGNPRGIYKDGDNVQVAILWTPPSAFAGIPLTEIADIFARLRISPSEGLRWSPDKRTKEEWAGKPIADVTGQEDEEISRMLKGWIETGTLIEGEYRHPKHRAKRNCVTLNETKAAEILGPLYHKPGADNDDF
jgi:hypothetical protein